MSYLQFVPAKLSALFLFSFSYASAGIRPSFYLESCSWNATDIVVITPAGGLTKFQVVETIKGDLKPGDLLDLPGLASSKGGSKKLAELVPQDLDQEFNSETWFVDPPPAQQGDRLIVFLRSPGALLEYDPRPDLPLDTKGWQPAQRWGGFLASAIWVQDGKLYAYIQTMNPGPTHLVEYGEPEQQLHSEVWEVLRLRAAMDRAAAIADPVERSRQLVVLVRSGDIVGGTFSRLSALRKLAAGGESEANALLGLLSDESLLGWHQDIIRALVGKPVADSHFGKFLGEETKYWCKACATLKPGWWNDMSNPEVELPQDHYTRALALLEAIRERQLSELIAEVQRFAVVWSGCPALEQYEGQDQIDEQLNLLGASASR